MYTNIMSQCEVPEMGMKRFLTFLSLSAKKKLFVRTKKIRFEDIIGHDTLKELLVKAI
ncbi:hypothetical protein BH18THE1_BH18THE1_18590 [soil metagenome]